MNTIRIEVVWLSKIDADPKVFRTPSLDTALDEIFVVGIDCNLEFLASPFLG